MPAKVSYQEKRKFARVTKRMLVYHRSRKAMGDYDFTQTLNFSEGGFLITTDKELLPKTEIYLKVRIPLIRGTRLVKGEVIESKKHPGANFYDTRIKLIQAAGETKLALAQIVGIVSKRQDFNPPLKYNLAILLVLFLLKATFCQGNAFGETIVLKSGKKVNKKILEKTNQYIKVDYDGVAVTYYLDEIECMYDDGQPLSAQESNLAENYSTDLAQEEDQSKNLGKEDVEQIYKNYLQAKYTCKNYEDLLALAKKYVTRKNTQALLLTDVHNSSSELKKNTLAIIKQTAINPERVVLTNKEVGDDGAVLSFLYKGKPNLIGRAIFIKEDGSWKLEDESFAQAK